jgi:WD40-like Beta Propeller Repeat
MSKVDDDLTRRLRQAERPVDGDGLFEGLERRRSHRERVRRVQAGLVAFAVLAATAGGFAILREAFDADERDVGASPPGVLPPNGEIVFSRQGGDGYVHLFASGPDGSGLRQITSGPTDDTAPAVSPDGRTVSYVRASDEFGLAIAIVPLEGGDVTKLADGVFVDDPAWSPDGSEIAFVTSGIDSMWVQMVDVNGQLTRSFLDVATTIASPSWSPDGTQIALGVVPGGTAGSVSIIPTNTMAESPLEETLGVGSAPAWSPDGSKIALIRSGDEGDEIWTVALDGIDETLIATRVAGSLQPDLAWAPDGTTLLVSDGDWIYRVDATPAGDPRENFVRLMQGRSPSWQPLPAGSDPSPTTTPEPSISLAPEAAGRDVGLGFGLCHVERLDGIDWYGDGTSGSAWTGARERQDGRCPQQGSGEYVVAADLNGDGAAEPGGMGFLQSCLFCRPYATTDLDANGVLELVVLEEASSTVSYSFYAVSVPTSERSPGIYNLFVAPPGHPEDRIRSGEPLRIDSGGDEGYSSQIRCWDGPEGRELGWAWSLEPVDSDGQKEVHVLRIQLHADGVFHVIGVEGYSVPRGEPSGLEPPPGPTCGVDWNPIS